MEEEPARRLMCGRPIFMDHWVGQGSPGFLAVRTLGRAVWEVTMHDDADSTRAFATGRPA